MIYILAGAPIQGYFYGNKSGHYLNNLLLKSLFSDENNYEYNIIKSFFLDQQFDQNLFHLLILIF